jgi:23S rRNA (adenine1618-N6)-methyltransferase
VFYFSSIVSQEADLKTIYKVLKQVKAHTVKTFPMNTGNKKGRVVAWTFKNKEEQKKWLLNKLK